MTSAPWVVVEGERPQRAAPEAPAPDAATPPAVLAAPFGALGAMTWLESAIVHRRWIAATPAMLGEIGASFQVSGERVRQVEVRLLARLRRELSDPGHPMLRLLRPSQRAAALATPAEGPVRPLVAPPYAPADVARICAATGLSVGTVRRALEGVSVRGETFAAVRRAVEALALPVALPAAPKPNPVQAIAKATAIDPRTVRKALRGKRVLRATAGAIRRAIAELELPVAPPPTHAPVWRGRP